MKKLKPMVWVTALLLSPAFSSCTKEEMKQKKAGSVPAQDDSSKKLARVGKNIIISGIYYEGNGFSGCFTGEGICMIIFRPVVSRPAPMRVVLTPPQGEKTLQVDKYKASGIETGYYPQVDIITDESGEEKVYFNE